MKKFLVQSIALLFVIAAAFYIYTRQITFLPFLPSPEASSVVGINDREIKVEIADDQAKRSKGLGGRESLASDSGMLFIFPDKGQYSFWMKGLKFPLDLIWIRDDTIVDIIENVPSPRPNQQDEDLPIYQSRIEVDKVLEVNAGVVERFQIKVGDKIILK
ncbi:MAG: DUF192 domain-containing protein [Candidatus Daviesbacteria bacterium]|nr:DUF192 domain-containing protein [Candidatus Daviesbacteria bacterium]